MTTSGFTQGAAFAPLSHDAVARLRAAVAHSALDPGRDDAPLRAVIADLAAEARAAQLRPEQLLPIFKTLLDWLPEMHAAQSRVEEAKLRERMITLCIKAYFAT